MVRRFVGTSAGAGKDAGGGGGGGGAKLGMLMMNLVVHPSFNGLLNWYAIFFSSGGIPLTLERAQSQGQRPNISDIPSKLFTGCTFLNSLHSHLNSWIKAIQVVTKLTRDVSSATVLQEINFWLSPERALERMEAQLRSEEVGMVMDALRNAKRFHATVSLTTDTRLKDTTDLGLLFFCFGIDEADGYWRSTSIANE